MLTLRDKDGIAMCLVSRSMARTLTKRYLGEWKNNSKGENMYVFREASMYGNSDVGILIFPGCYINTDDEL